MQLRAHPDFGKQLQRAFAVHENCYDCAGFYDGCRAWPVATEFACGEYNPLPDVPAGTCGQRFPATARKLASSTEQDHQAECRSGPDPDDQVPPGDSGEAPAPVVKLAGISAGAAHKERRCGCGSPLPKGKRLCDQCRIQNRRKTKREYMQTYREQQGSAPVDAGSGVPATAHSTQSYGAGGSDLPLRVV